MRKRGVALGACLSASLFLLSVSVRADDGDIQQRVESRLTKSRLVQEPEIRVAVRDGRVTLNGVVTTLAARNAAEKAAHKESKQVENLIRVVPDARSDDEILKAAQNTILRYPQLTIFDSIELGVDGGVVLLRGSVNQPYRKTDIEARVASLAGVTQIRNEIEVQPVSIFDDQLRRQLARRIYGSEHFVRYAIQANPPIRIVVNKGNVTLTGYVGHPVEQALLGTIARSSLAFKVDNLVKVDGDVPAEKKPSPCEWVVDKNGARSRECTSL